MDLFDGIGGRPWHPGLWDAIAHTVLTLPWECPWITPAVVCLCLLLTLLFPQLAGAAGYGWCSGEEQVMNARR